MENRIEEAKDNILTHLSELRCVYSEAELRQALREASNEVQEEYEDYINDLAAE